MLKSKIEVQSNHPLVLIHIYTHSIWCLVVVFPNTSAKNIQTQPPHYQIAHAWVETAVKPKDHCEGNERHEEAIRSRQVKENYCSSKLILIYMPTFCLDRAQLIILILLILKNILNLALLAAFTVH